MGEQTDENMESIDGAAEAADESKLDGDEPAAVDELKDDEIELGEQWETAAILHIPAGELSLDGHHLRIKCLDFLNFQIISSVISALLIVAINLERLNARLGAF